MSKITVTAPAKLNLTFEILGSLPDGYHEVRTLFQAIDLADELTFELQRGTTDGVSLIIDGAAPAGFPMDDSNLITRAARLFFQEMEESSRTHLRVEVCKRIPLQAGLAGGSADAAATLVALNFLHDHALTTHELAALAAQLGSDVPFCLQGGTCLATGRGEHLQPLEVETKLFFLLVKPRNLSISTPWIYQEYDRFTLEGKFAGAHIDSAAAAEALASDDLSCALGTFGNAFEPLVFQHFPQLAAIKQRLLDLGSSCCHITGSGPTLYAVASDREMSHYLRREMLPLAQEQQLDIFITDSVSHGAQVVVSETAEL